MRKSWYDVIVDAFRREMNVRFLRQICVEQFFGVELMHHADLLCFKSCTRPGNGSPQSTCDNLIHDLFTMSSLKDDFLESEYTTLIMGRVAGPKAIRRMGTICGVRWMGDFKAYFACSMLGKRFPDICNPVILGPLVHLKAANSSSPCCRHL